MQIGAISNNAWNLTNLNQLFPCGCSKNIQPPYNLHVNHSIIHNLDLIWFECEWGTSSMFHRRTFILTDKHILEHIIMGHSWRNHSYVNEFFGPSLLWIHWYSYECGLNITNDLNKKVISNNLFVYTPTHELTFIILELITLQVRYVAD